MYRKSAFACAAVLAIGSAAIAQTEKPVKTDDDVKPLTVGDPARPIEISHWIKGSKVEQFDEGKVYVLEFWATWCGPCRASMPHITEVQEQYKDYGVTFIGISDEELAIVVKFLASKDKDTLWYDKIGYTLATDPDRSVYRDYMTAAAQRGIPTAFIIGKDRRVEWVGHPMGIDKALDAVVKDNWNRDEFKVTWEKEQAASREAMKVQTALRTALKEKDWDTALGILDESIAKYENDFNPKMQKFMIMLTQMEQPERAYAYANDAVKAHWDDSMALNQIAWTVVDSPQIKNRNIDFALKTAQRASELTENKNPMILDTLARAYYEKGDLQNAVRWQKKAVEHAEDGPMGEDIAKTLKKYVDELASKGSR